MSRLHRVDIAGHPYHVIQRGNRKQKVFVREGDERKYLRILKLQASLYQVDIWAYALMGNHVHLIVCPNVDGALTPCIGETHRQYTLMINFREKWRGYLWQGRFKSFIMDPRYLFAAVRYIERNPVRSGLVAKAEEYAWSSAWAHVQDKDDGLLTRCYLQDNIANWRDYLATPDDHAILRELRLHANTTRPLGSKEFIVGLEADTGFVLQKQKPGPARRLIKDTVCGT